MGPSESVYLVEGQDIRAVEGTVVLKTSEKRWQVEVRKTTKGYHLHNKDIVIGLVRPEKRNIGFFLYDYQNAFGSPDGVAVVRQKSAEYPIEWVFQALRTEQSRIQFWTESGGTSYGKLTTDQIKNVLIPIPDRTVIEEITAKVRCWADAQQQVQRSFEEIWRAKDKRAILNSPVIGLEGSSLAIDSDEE